MPKGKEDKSQVPDFVLTEEHKAWFKEYSKILRMEKMIEKGIIAEMPKLQQMRLMYEEVQGKKQEMMKMAPVKPTMEIEGQRELVQEQAQPGQGGR